MHKARAGDVSSRGRVGGMSGSDGLWVSGAPASSGW